MTDPRYPGEPETGYYPLAMQNLFSKLPTEIPYWQQPINLIFSHIKENFSIPEIVEFVKFQYQQESIRSGIPSLPESFTVQIMEYNKNVFKSLDDGDHLQSSLNMIFSLAPYAKVHLIYFDSIEIDNVLGVPKEEKVDYNYLYDKIRELQTQYPDAVYCTNYLLAVPYVSADFYYYYLLGEPSLIDKNRRNPIQIPMFLAAGNDKWIKNGAAFEAEDINYYDFCWFSKNFFCHVGGALIDYTAYENNSSGFCLPSDCLPLTRQFRFSKLFYVTYDPLIPDYYVTRDCNDILPVEYQYPFNTKLDTIFRKSFRIPDVCMFTGPYILSNKTLKPVYGTSWSSIVMAVQFTQMKFFYNGLEGKPFFLPGEGSFIAKMYDIQLKYNGGAFQYINKGIINYSGSENPSPLNDCSLDIYKYDRFYGLNPCGLGIPKWVILNPSTLAIAVNPAWVS